MRCGCPVSIVDRSRTLSYGGASRTEQGAADRDSFHAAIHPHPPYPTLFYEELLDDID